MESHLDIHNPDIIALSETWTRENSIIPLLDGYNHAHSPSVKGRAGGVLFYYRVHLDVCRLHISNNVIAGTEAEFLSVQLPKYLLNLLLTYRHPGTSLDPFCQSLTNIMECREFNDINFKNVILGDINIDISKVNSATKKYIDQINLNNYEFAFFTPTRITHEHQSCIDHVIYNCNCVGSIHCTIIPLGITDHETIIIDIQHNYLHTDTPMTRKHKKTSIRLFTVYLDSVNWCDFFRDTNDTNECVNRFLHFIFNTYENFFPLEKANTCHKNSKWCNSKITYLIKKKNYLLRKYRKSKKCKDKSLLAKHVSLLKSYVRNTKNAHIKNSLTITNMKDKWGLINKLINKKGKTKKALSDKLTSDDFILFYGNHFSQPSNSCSHLGITSTVCNTCALHHVEEKDVRSHISSFPNKPSRGTNDLPMFMWRNICDSVVTPITILINKMIDTSTFPDVLKQSDLTPIHKKGNVDIIDNYRPISCIHNLAKIFEKVIYKCMIGFVNSFSILPPCQFGFRPGHSTKDALVQLLLNIENCRGNNGSVCLVSIDFSKAFDTVCHITLLKILYSLGFRGKMYDLLNSYLSNRFFRINYRSNFSKFLPIERGVPQGSVLGPLFYSLYVHDFNKLVSTSIVQYADDTTILIPFSNYTNLQESLDSLSTNLHNFCSDRNLKLNPDKTVIVIFGVTTVSNVNFLNHRHTVSSSCKILGTIVDNKLKFNLQCNAIAKNIKRSFPLLYHLRDYTHNHLKRMLFQSFVCSHIIYCCPFLHMSYTNSINTIKSAYNKAFRILFKRPYDESLSSILHLYNLHTLVKVIHIHSAVYAHKIFHHKVPNSISTCFTRSRRQNFILNSHNPHTSIHNSLSMLWNDLPDNIKSLSSYMFSRMLAKS